MNKNDLKNKTTEKLQSELKGIKIITGALSGVLTIFFAVTIYGLITKEDNSTFIALIAVAISCSAFLPFQFIKMKKIKTEFKQRERAN